MSINSASVLFFLLASYTWSKYSFLTSSWPLDFILAISNSTPAPVKVAPNSDLSFNASLNAFSSANALASIDSPSPTPNLDKGPAALLNAPPIPLPSLGAPKISNPELAILN